MVQKNDLHQYKPILSLGFLLLWGSLFPSSSQAQVTPDRSLGAESSIPRVIPGDPTSELIVNGAQRGGNLFHSFEEFNIGEGRGVYFNNPQGVSNIFSRVSGGNPSKILGKLGVLGEANLFFLNPNGVLFGPNASLALSGSLIVSTARGIQFADGTTFSTDLTQSSPLLSVSTPIGLQFTQAAAKPIVVEGQERELTDILQSVPRDIEGPSEILGVVQELLPELLDRSEKSSILSGKTIALVGGDVTLAGGRLTASGGRIELGSVVGTGNVSLSPISSGWALGYEGVENSALGQIQLSQLALLNTGSSTRGGEIQIRGRQVNLSDESVIFAPTFGNQDGGNIEIRAQEVNVTNGSIVGTGTISTGDSGDITIETDHLIVQGSSLIETGTVGLGKSGNITIRASDSVNVIDDGYVVTGTLGTPSSQTGDAGNIFIETQTLNLINGGEISNGTSTGLGGNLIVEASESVNVQDFDSAIYTDTYGVGNAGVINITTGYLSVTNGGKISAATLNEGKGGDIQIKARDEVRLEGVSASADSTFPSGVFTSSGLPGDENYQPKGAGGNLFIEAGSLTLRDRATISASSVSPGNSGGITLKIAGSFSATDGDITATAERASGGSINITAQNIRLQGNSDITTNVSGGTGVGGNITLSADSILAFDDSDILAFAQDGQGGNINLDTPIFFGNGYQTTDEIQDPQTLDNNALADINASGIVSGVITIPDLTFIQNSLLELPETLIDPENLIANSCVIPNQQKAGTFILTGPEGLPSRPNTNITSPYPTGTVETIPQHPEMVEPQGFYRLDDGQIVLSRKCF